MTTRDDTDKYGRLHWFTPEELTERQREYYDRVVSGPRDRASLVDDRGRLRGAFNARLLDPAVGTAIAELGAVLRFGTPALTGRQRELAILEIARHERSEYEWTAHAKTGVAAGLRPEEIAALREGTDPGTFLPAETLTRQVVRTLLTERDLDDALFDRAERELGLVALFDLVSLVGYYQHTALSLRVWRVPTDAADHAAGPAGGTPDTTQHQTPAQEA